MMEGDRRNFYSRARDCVGQRGLQIVLRVALGAT
jgi:hypothetical protein